MTSEDTASSITCDVCQASPNIRVTYTWMEGDVFEHAEGNMHKGYYGNNVIITKTTSTYKNFRHSPQHICARCFRERVSAFAREKTVQGIVISLVGLFIVYSQVLKKLNADDPIVANIVFAALIGGAIALFGLYTLRQGVNGFRHLKKDRLSTADAAPYQMLFHEDMVTRTKQRRTKTAVKFVCWTVEEYQKQIRTSGTK